MIILKTVSNLRKHIVKDQKQRHPTRNNWAQRKPNKAFKKSWILIQTTEETNQNREQLIRLENGKQLLAKLKI